jgi:predicted amidohydrolase
MTGPAEARSFRAALVQMCSGRDVDKNVSDATTLIRAAATGGADYVQTPEMTTLMELDRERLLAAAASEETTAALAHFKALAA